MAIPLILLDFSVAFLYSVLSETLSCCGSSFSPVATYLHVTVSQGPLISLLMFFLVNLIQSHAFKYNLYASDSQNHIFGLELSLEIQTSLSDWVF